MPNTKSMNCSFCANKQIPGPHGHSIRDFTKNNKPITCPHLLSIECQYCHEKGHTVKYCNVLKDKKLSHENMSNSYCIKESRPNKRNVLDNDGFTTFHKNETNVSFNNKDIAINKAQKLSNLTNCFEVLNMDSYNDKADSDLDNLSITSSSNQDNDMDTKSMNSSTISWAKVVSIDKKKPTFNFTANNNTNKWGDISDHEDDSYFGDN